MSLPVTVRNNKGTASGFALGKTLLVTLTLAPNGMEDLPGRIREEIHKESKKLGFEPSLIIDSHNSLGEKPNEVDSNDLIKLPRKSSIKSPAKISLISSSDLLTVPSSALKIEGISARRESAFCFLKIKDSRFCLVVVDANNAKIGFRAKVIEKFQTDSSARILDICTSDTHVTAAKASNAKGYLALGDVSTPEEFVSTLDLLFDKAYSRLGNGVYSTSVSEVMIRTIGGEILNNFSGLLDETSNVAKRGAQALGILAVLVTAIVAII